MPNLLNDSFSVGYFLYKYRIYIVFLLVPLSVFAFLYSPNIQFKADLSKYLPKGNSDLEFYENFASVFGDRNDFLSIGIFRSEGVFEQAFLKKVQSLSDSCRALELVKRTHSILNISEARNTPFGILYSPLLDLSKESKFKTDSIKIINHPLVKGQLLSADGTTLLVLLELEGERAVPSSQELIDRLNELLDSFNFEDAHIIGPLILEMNHTRLTSQEVLFFIQVCIALIVILLLVIYRSFVAMLLPLIIFLLSIFFLGALLALIGISLDSLSTMLPTILLIVSISDVIHLFAKMQSPGKSELKKLIHAIDKVARTNFLTSLTTAIGFFTLIISPMPTLVDFGVAVGLGVLIAYILSTLIVPLTFFWLPNKIPEPKGVFSKDRWQKLAEKQIFQILKRPKSVYAGLLFFILLSGVGINSINYDRFLTSTMPLNNEIRSSYQFFDEKFNGSREFEIAISAQEKEGLLKLDNLELINQMQNYLDSMQKVGGTLSPNTFFKIANNVFYAKNKSEYSLPDNQEKLDRLNKRVPKSVKHRFRSVMDSTMTYGAIRGHMHDIGMLNHVSFMEDIDNWINRQPNGSQLKFQHTGIPMLLDKISLLQLKANFIGLLIAAIFISLLIALLFQRWIFILVTLIGNLLPLILIAGIMGATHIEMRGSTSLIFSVAFVIIVDDTIHFLSNFLQNIRSGQGIVMAIQDTIRYTGHAIFLTTIVLAIVTFALLWSSLPDIRNLGFLLSVALIIALIFDLVLIPVLLKTGFHGQKTLKD